MKDMKGKTKLDMAIKNEGGRGSREMMIGEKFAFLMQQVRSSDHYKMMTC